MYKFTELTDNILRSIKHSLERRLIEMNNRIDAEMEKMSSLGRSICAVEWGET